MKFLGIIFLVFLYTSVESQSISLGSGPGFISGNCILLPEAAIVSAKPLVSQSSIFILWNLIPFVIGNTKLDFCKLFTLDASITGLWLNKGQGIIQAFSKDPLVETSIRSVSFSTDVKSSFVGYKVGFSSKIPYLRDFFTLRAGFVGSHKRARYKFLYDPTIFYEKETESGVYAGFNAELHLRETRFIFGYDFAKIWIKLRESANNDPAVVLRKISLLSNAFSLALEYRINESFSISESVIYESALNKKLGKSTTFTPNQSPTTLCNVKRFEAKSILLQTKIIYEF